MPKQILYASLFLGSLPSKPQKHYEMHLFSKLARAILEHREDLVDGKKKADQCAQLQKIKNVIADR